MDDESGDYSGLGDTACVTSPSAAMIAMMGLSLGKGSRTQTPTKRLNPRVPTDVTDGSPHLCIVRQDAYDQARPVTPAIRHVYVNSRRPLRNAGLKGLTGLHQP